MKPTYAPWGASLDELVAAARAADDAGFDALWVPELHRSAFVPAAAIAAATRRARVGTAIALAFVRSPMITALEALDVDEIARGRFVLGIGSGVKRLNTDWHNARFGAPAPHLRETIAAIRRLIAEMKDGAPIEIDGEYEPVRLRGYQRPFPQARDAIPIHIAAVGEVMTRLAGEIADGWLGHELGSPAYLRERLVPNLEKGLARAGRARDSLEVVPSACCAIDDDARTAKRWGAGLVAFYATVKTYDDFFDFHGFAAEAKAVQAAFRAGDERAMVDAVPDAMVDAVMLAGTPDQVRAQLAAYVGLADAIKISPPTHLVPEEVTRTCQQRILEVLAP
jgi:probable F420-dependent oxidoreductase